jgi:hypothetical protein
MLLTCKCPRSVEWEPPHNVAPYRPENDRLLSDPSSSGPSGSRVVPSLKMGTSQPARLASSLPPRSPKDEPSKSSLSSSSKPDASAVFDLDTGNSRAYASSCARLKPQTTLAFWEITKSEYFKRNLLQINSCVLWQRIIFSSCCSLGNLGSEPITHRLQCYFFPEGYTEDC